MIYNISVLEVSSLNSFSALPLLSGSILDTWFLSLPRVPSCLKHPLWFYLDIDVGIRILSLVIVTVINISSQLGCGKCKNFIPYWNHSVSCVELIRWRLVTELQYHTWTAEVFLRLAQKILQFFTSQTPPQLSSCTSRWRMKSLHSLGAKLSFDKDH